MFDILFFVIENYLPETRPEPRALAHKLSAAGFGEDDIAEALDWLHRLDALETELGTEWPATPSSLRLYDEREMEKLDFESRALLMFLEQAEAIDGAARELIIEAAMALPEDTVDAEAMKIIVLMVLWRRQIAMEPLILEELLADEDDETTMH